MTTIKIPGVKSYDRNGRVYYYLRATADRIVDPDTGTPLDPVADLTAFVLRVEAMKAEAMGLRSRSRPKAATLLGLIEAYCGAAGAPGRAKLESSPEWQNLSQATRKSYQRILDPEQGNLRRAINLSLDKITLDTIDKPNVVRLRNKVKKKFGFWTANYAVKVLRSLFKWGVLYGHMEVNPATGVPEIERPVELAVKHRTWSPEEFTAMVDEARCRGLSGVVLALYLARYAGWAVGDIVYQPPTVWQSPRLVYVRRKTRKRRSVTSLLAPDGVLAILDAFPPDMEARTLVTDAAGRSYTEERLRQLIRRLCTHLAANGKVKPGLNIHGLRHSLGKELYELGLDREARKAVMAHESDAASKVYERDGDRSQHADRGVHAINRQHSEARDTGTREL